MYKLAHEAIDVTCDVSFIQLLDTSLPETLLHSGPVPGRGDVVTANLGGEQETVLCCFFS